MGVGGPGSAERICGSRVKWKRPWRRIAVVAHIYIYIKSAGRIVLHLPANTDDLGRLTASPCADDRPS